MADLSPQAQAVLDAIQPPDWEASPLRDAAWERMAKQVAVATLKAAADQMGCYQSKKFLYSIADAMKLRAIADELDQA
jgi:hypothetical protein